MNEVLQPWFCYLVLSILALVTFPYLFRSMIGPTFFDRILAVNNVSTLVTIMICILAVVQGEHYIVDVALIYSMLGFVTVIIVCRAYLRSHNKEDYEHFDRFIKSKEERENES
ncbi:MAG: monovalent cation/H+ antiporter complex subunit F [Eubacteriales bacterium]